MRNYINEIDKSLIEKVVGTFLAKEWFAKIVVITKQKDFFIVAYSVGDGNYFLKVKNFGVDFNSKCMWCNALDRKLRVALCTKFGEEYFEDLKNYLSKIYKTKDDKVALANELKIIARLKNEQKEKNA